MNSWNIDQSRKLYNIERWGAPYFNINSLGHVTVCSNTAPDAKIDLYHVTQEIEQSGLNLPVLIRVTNILEDRINTLHNAFEVAKEKHSFNGDFHAVYPIKVNQQRTVVEHLISQPNHCIGLEAGSKPELMVVLSHADQQSMIICNGYKDREYIRLALIGQKIGLQVFIVIEKISELKIVLEESKQIDVSPLLGIRIRLASIGKGKWQNTGGEKSKFGLSANQVLSILNILDKNNATQCLTLIHCHLGSQLANIHDIQNGMHEIARYYAELCALGIPIEYIDVGGGLGIDYEGSRSRNFCSMNYSIQEYANDITQTLKQVCSEKNIPHPNIITESGRAMTAHHAVLVTNIVDAEPVISEDSPSPPTDNDPIVLHHLWETFQNFSSRSVVEAYHDASHWLSESQIMYTHGILNLKQRAFAEQLYFSICRNIQSHLSPRHRAHREIMDKLNEKLAEKYFCNLSIFQSLPDIWAIDQVFPIMPIHRLNEEPAKRITIQDLTCDSDGKVENYVEEENIETTLAAHELIENQPYIVGFFLVGAYQEILGDMHNLFGDTHSVDLTIDNEGNYVLAGAEPGDTIEDVLGFIHYSPSKILENYQAKINKAPISQQQKNIFLTELQQSLKAYTYLKD